MPVLGITGGAACGKSSFSKLLGALLPGSVLFSADAEVQRLVSGDARVRAGLEELFGPRAFDASGAYDRPYVRTRVFADPSLREQLNALLHPRVRESWAALAQEFHNSRNWLLAEIPLLYETHGQVLCNRVATVACSPQTQWHRLTVLRALPEAVAEQIRVAQASLEEKSNRAEHLIWNDCPLSCLSRQAALFAAWLLRPGG